MFFLVFWNRFAFAQEIQEASSTQVWVECQPISGLFELSEHLPVSMKNGTGAFSRDTMETFSQLGGGWMERCLPMASKVWIYCSHTVEN